MRLIRNPSRKRKPTGRLPISCYCYMQDVPGGKCDMCHIFNAGAYDVCGCGIWLKNSQFAHCDECTLSLYTKRCNQVSIRSRRNKRQVIQR
ncbi:hypothetical protein PV-S19_0093 [Pacmanvirus S19]|nr:hypothetical protein PV-S19_0093 [Pacmanvirus S19]